MDYSFFKYIKHSCANYCNKNQQVNNDDKKLRLSNVTLTNNHSEATGGAINCYIGKGIFINVTIINNYANNNGTGGGGIFSYSNSIVVNSILWNNSPNQVSDSTYTTVNIFYSNVMGGWPGTGNINSDPMFADTANGDFSLQSGSPCIDAGTAFFEFGGDTLINLQSWQYNYAAPDMGAYEFGPPLEVIEELNQPDTYTLKQNYPNPFNPTTTIEFSIPKSEFVTLKVYNVLGQEVTTLVSEKLKGGSYKYDWDAGNLASGVYLYKLQAAEFLQIKKMILIK